MYEVNRAINLDFHGGYLMGFQRLAQGTKLLGVTPIVSLQRCFFRRMGLVEFHR
jgi:hypothetical protein